MNPDQWHLFIWFIVVLLFSPNSILLCWDSQTCYTSRWNFLLTEPHLQIAQCSTDWILKMNLVKKKKRALRLSVKPFNRHKSNGIKVLLSRKALLDYKWYTVTEATSKSLKGSKWLLLNFCVESCLCLNPHLWADNSPCYTCEGGILWGIIVCINITFKEPQRTLLFIFKNQQNFAQAQNLIVLYLWY